MLTGLPYILVIFFALDGVTPPEISRHGSMEECGSNAVARVAEHHEAGKIVEWSGCQRVISVHRGRPAGSVR